MPTGFGVSGGSLRRAGFEPADEQLVVLAARLEPLAAGVRHLAGRLVHDQAVVGRGEVDAPAAHLAGDAEVVAVGVVAEQRQPEPVLAGADPWHFPVLQPAFVRTGSTSVRKRSALGVRRLRDVTGTFAECPACLTVSVADPSAVGARKPLVTVATGLSSVNVGGGGHVAGAAVGELGLDDDALPVAGAGQLDRGRRDGDPHRRRRRPRRRGGRARRTATRTHTGTSWRIVGRRSRSNTRRLASPLTGFDRRRHGFFCSSRSASSGLSGLPVGVGLHPAGRVDLQHPAAADAVHDLLPADRAGQFAHQRRVRRPAAWSHRPSRRTRPASRRPSPRPAAAVGPRRQPVELRGERSPAGSPIRACTRP